MCYLLRRSFFSTVLLFSDFIYALQNKRNSVRAALRSALNLVFGCSVLSCSFALPPRPLPPLRSNDDRTFGFQMPVSPFFLVVACVCVCVLRVYGIVVYKTTFSTRCTAKIRDRVAESFFFAYNHFGRPLHFFLLFVLWVEWMQRQHNNDDDHDVDGNAIIVHWKRFI